MTLSLFHQQPPLHFSELEGAGEFSHTFGGTPHSFGIRFTNCSPLHLIYRLDLADPAAPVGRPDLKWLALVYHFSDASFAGELVYQVRSDTEIQVLSPALQQFNPDFPYSNFPPFFDETAIHFERQPYECTRAEDAVRMAALFGLNSLSDVEMERAVELADESCGTISAWGLPDWTPENIVRSAHREPFAQGSPIAECTNPDCSAPIEYRRKSISVSVNDELADFLGDSTFAIPARDVRQESLRVFAIVEPTPLRRQLWGDQRIQLIYQICELCKCIRVTNQCE
jgi:hypothetical protein